MEELKANRTYNPCDECPYGVEKRDGSGNDSKLLNRRAAPENDYAALKAQYDEINRYNVSCTKKIDELLAEKLDTDAHLKAINDSLSEQLRRAAPENKPLTLDELRKMDGGWVWLTDAKHPEYDGWYNVRPFHDESGGIELYGVDNNYYERAITAGSVKVYTRKPEGDNDVH